MTKKVGPYVGVTGFMSCIEVKFALMMVPYKSTRRLMAGVLVNSNTLAGQGSKRPGRYPRKEAIAGIFVGDPRVLNLVHFSTEHPETLVEQLTEITLLAGPNLDGFQLNMAWPPVLQLEEYRKANPEKFLLLQIGGKAMAQVEWMGGFEALIAQYLPIIDAILVDSSGGRGVPLDAAKGAPYLRAVAHGQATIGLGIAGGLGPDTIHLVDPLVREFPELSIDAEGMLRTPQPEDALSLDAMQNYLEDSFPILAGQELPGVKLRKFCEPYGLEELARHYGRGDNMLRTSRFAQPGALNVGDIIATGDKVLSPPREGYNGSVNLHLTGGFNGHWVGVPARIPIAFLTEGDNAPEEVLKRSKD